MIRTLTITLATGLLLLAGSSVAEQYCDHQAPDLVNSKPVVLLQTSLGDIEVQLDAVRAPRTVENFLNYVDSGFYDGTQFHRIIPGFMAQGGGFTTDHQQKASCEPVVNESGNGLSNSRGTIAMARLGEPHSGSSQFYINLVNNPKLDPNPQRWGYAVFGHVISGMEVVDAMAEVPTGTVPAMRGHRDVPLTPVELEKATIIGGVAPEAADTQ